MTLPTLRDRPAHLQPREKILGMGPQHMGTDELLAILLGTGRPGEDAIRLAARILLEAGGLSNLQNLSPERLQEIQGVGPARSAMLMAIPALFQRLAGEVASSRPTILRARDLVQLLAPRLSGLDHEVFVAAYLDASHRLIGHEELFAGGLNWSGVSPRVVVCKALERRAASVILLHNHPSGLAHPSAEDRRLTRRLQEALNLVEIRLLDHLVVASGHVESVLEG
ncbi:MAG: DNA repair protein RadC [Planctomycetota bacterium]